MHSFSRCTVAAVLAMAVGGCGLLAPKTAPPRELELNRDTPRKAYEYFKFMVKNEQYSAEWSVFSPNFKRMLNQVAGRNVDEADYALARTTVATNSQADMQLLLNSTWNGVRLSPDGNRAQVSITAGGRAVSPTMVKLTRWELKVRGEPTPYSDFVRQVSDHLRIAQDGTISVAIRPPGYTAPLIRSLQPQQVEYFRLEPQWYVDDFGGLDQLVGEADDANGARPAPAPAQPGFPPGAGSGSPDGPPATGFGSPDG